MRDTSENGWRRDWSSFGTPQIAAFALLGVAVLILGLWFMRWSTAPTWSLVASGLTATEVTDARDELDAAGIENRLANGGTAIEVPTAAVDEASVLLGDAGVIDGQPEGYEILDRQGFTTSSFKQRIDYQRAVEGELAQTISAMEAVSSATVHLAIPESSVFSENQSLTRASVVVSGAPDQSTVASIVNIVSSAVPDLDPANVTVADTSGRILSSADEAGMMQDRQLAMQELFESQLELDAETMLAAALGPGKAVVRVSADLDFDEIESEELTYVRPEEGEEPLVLRQEIVDEAFTGSGAVPGGALGVIDDVTDIGQIAGEDGNAYIRQEDASEFGVPTIRTVTRNTPGQVDRLTVAVMIDGALDPAPSEEDIRRLVENAVGVDTGRGDDIQVAFIPFDQTAAEEAAAAAEEAAASAGGEGGMGTILGYVKTAVAIIGILLALFFLRKGLRPLFAVKEERQALDAGDIPNALGAGSDDEKQRGDAADPTTLVPVVAGDAGRLGAGNNAGPSLLETDPEAASTVDMLQLIDQQPDEVADLLRGWMAEAN